MKTNVKINENLNVEVNKKINRTIIALNKNGEKIVLSDLKTDECFFSNVKFDENYVVVYSRGCMANQIPLKVEAAYNIKTNCILDVKNDIKLAKELEYMLISKWGFDITTIISVINQSDLKIAEEDEIEHITRYLTNGNKEITKEEIAKYILSIYPELAKYQNLNPSISVLEYKRILKEIDNNILFFHKMPQIIDSSEEKQKFNVLAVPCRKALVVDSEKTQEFKELKPKDNEHTKKLTRKLKINDFIRTESKLKKPKK